LNREWQYFSSTAYAKLGDITKSESNGQIKVVERIGSIFHGHDTII
jgi:hypothetical protein